MSKLNIITREFTTKDIDGVATGMTDKYWNACRALDINVTHLLKNVSGVCLIDPLWLWETPDTEDGATARWEELQQLNAIKIIWAEEQELLRWTRIRRMEFVNHCDLVTTCNKFLQGIFEEFGIKSDILYTPIDEGYWMPAEKKKPIVIATAKIMTAKGAERYIELFDLLGSDVECVYIGHAGMWNNEPTPQERELEREIAKRCTWIKYANRNKMREIFSEAAVYVNFARYDVGSLSFLQAGMSGCHCLLWNEHRQFDEYIHTKCVMHPKHAAELIEDIFTSERIETNTTLREFLIARHGLSAFRKNLNEIITKCIGV